jgi:hypothetical protein
MRESGSLIIADPGADRPIAEAATIQCVHCGRHWVARPGSGRIRGFCLRCHGPICGPGCAECVPIEQQLDNLEAGRPILHRPIVLSIRTGRRTGDR